MMMDDDDDETLRMMMMDDNDDVIMKPLQKLFIKLNKGGVSHFGLAILHY